MKIDVYTSKGTKKKESMSFPKDLAFDGDNLALLAQAVHVYQHRQHPGLSKVQTRGEVTASGRKIYKQKGTGNARHSSKAAPIFVGGGKAHGPKGVKRLRVLPKKMATRARAVAFAVKISANEVVGVEKVDWKKTAEAASFVSAIRNELGKKKTAKVTVALADENATVRKALKNVPNVVITPFRNLNAFTIYRGGTVIVDTAALTKKK